DTTDPSHISILARTVEDKVNRLSSIKDTLDLFRETQEVGTVPHLENSGGVANPQKIFLVHGRNDAARLEVQHFVERVTRLDVVVLADRPSQGQTIIEKLEGHFENSAFAVVLMTADDEGRLRGGGELQFRARQNVVLELGMAVAKLGRRNVAVLYEDGVEMPSDYYGVVFTPFDSGGGWKLKLVGELRSAGIEADANAIFS
ncbi:TIR domain-containing protein, partial [Frankia sp. AgKG'84/4]|uniref:TIR domain-containing protein n=1 Tax=Frankia sp. AgKG'84/4 TaxID=573490 RepID=UPI002029FB47